MDNLETLKTLDTEDTGLRKTKHNTEIFKEYLKFLNSLYDINWFGLWKA
jgi:hypothetical protein